MYKNTGQDSSVFRNTLSDDIQGTRRLFGDRVECSVSTANGRSTHKRQQQQRNRSVQTETKGLTLIASKPTLPCLNRISTQSAKGPRV
jgi:hypothetical protein